MESRAAVWASKRSSRWIVLALVASAWALVGAGHASASHFRYAHINWAPAASPANTINFRLQVSWRRGYPFIGGCRNATTGGSQPCTGPGGLPGAGDFVNEPLTVLNPGQGASIGAPFGDQGMWYHVTAIDAANDWLFADALDPTSLPSALDTQLTKTYTAPGTYLAFWDTAARLSATAAPNRHLNNPDGGFRVETPVTVSAAGNRSPVSTMPPIVLCPINGVCAFVVPAFDPDGDPVTYRLSTPSEASSTFPVANYLSTSCPTQFCQPGPPFAPNAASISAGGLYTWNTTGAQQGGVGFNTLYSTQVMIEDRTAANVVKTKVPVDFLIRLVPSVGSPPAFDHPPTPACGSTQEVFVGSAMTFGVQASDSDAGDVVTLTATGMPAGATMTPPLPTTGNPVSSTFNWTPGAAGTFVVSFAATDQTLQQTLCAITVRAVNTGTLQVIKHVINDNGGSAGAAAFTLDSGGTNDSPDDFPGNESGTAVTLDAGSYSVTETGPSGYTQTLSADCSGTIAAGQTKTCTVTNDDQPAKLVVIKHVINDNGGSAGAAAFTLDSGGANDSPDAFPGDEAGTSVSLDAGSYGVSESGPSGYAASFSAGCAGTIAPGETKTCTVTNNDQPAQLKVVKHVINDNGGTAGAADFTLASGGVNASPATFLGDEGGTTVTLDAGSYNVSETGPSGYTESSSAACSGSIAIGETRTCTVTNDDQPAKLVVIKHVINDNGGSATAASFTLDSGGANDTPSNFPGSEAGTNVTLDAGSYTVSETGPSGYSASFSADCAGSIAAGQTKTCTVTNDDQPAHLTVIKKVVNDNGGGATAAQFTLDSGGASASPSNFPGDEGGTAVTLNAGSYSVTETGPQGYAASYSAGCAGSIAPGEAKTCTVTNDDIAPRLTVIKHVINDNGGGATAAQFTLDSGGASASPSSFPGDEGGTAVTLNAGSYSVTETGPSGYSASFSTDCAGTIAVGQTKTCTVTNNDQPAHLIVTKHVVNDSGGGAAASAFTLDSGGTNDTPDNFPGDEGGTNVTLDAGAYSVTETGPTGYTSSSSADCAGTIGPGQTKTCTVTNDDQPAHLIVVKHVAAGPATASQFTMTINGVTATGGNSFAGAESPGTDKVVTPGSYTVTETGPPGYIASFSAGCQASIALGQTKTCTVTNTLASDTTPHHVYETGTTCQNFRDTPTRAELAQIQYTTKGTAIAQVNPGVFFYYASVQAPSSGTWTIANVQTNDSTTPAWRPIGTNNDQIILYTSACVRVQGTTVSYANGTATITVNAGSYTPGATYVYSVKYDPNTLLGQAVSTNQAVAYVFWTVNQGVTDFGSFDAVKVTPKK